MREEFTAVYEKRGKWYVGYVEEMPGANTQGRTLGEAKRNLKEAVRLVIEVNRELTERRIGAGAIKQRLVVAV